MAINKRAKNIYTKVDSKHTSIAGCREIIAKRLFVYSTKEDLDLVSNQRVVIEGDKKE